MGANKFFFSQFRRGLRLIADYQFNNNLIDDANGYNLVGTDITYDNGSAVFNGISSVASRTDANNIFSFTDGVKDLPFRIETKIRFNSFDNIIPFIASKRDGSNFSREWQIYYDGYQNVIKIILFTNSSSNNYLVKGCLINEIISFDYNIVITYDGSKSIDGLKIFVNGVDGDVMDIVGSYVGMSKTQSDFNIGNSFYITDSRIPFNGEIDYLKIYK